jgi:hypothetical protein
MRRDLEGQDQGSETFQPCAHCASFYEAHFKEYCLDHDVANVLQRLIHPNLTEIYPLPEYEEYIRCKNDPNIAKVILNLSDPYSVEEFNSLIREINAYIESLNGSSPTQEVINDFLARGEKIVFRERERREKDGSEQEKGV